MPDRSSRNAADAMENAVLPEAYSIRVPRDKAASAQEEGRAERHKDLSQKSAAEWAYDRVALYIQNFEKTLNADQEVGMGFAGSDAGMLRIEGMGYFAPDMITFYGRDPMGKQMQLIQHVSQLNVMLVAEPRPVTEDEPNRIGFQLRGEVDPDAG
ncbi:MAG: DUF6173 family protein [Pseudomonadota bacterium]